MKAAGSMASAMIDEGPQAGAPAVVVEEVGGDRRVSMVPTEPAAETMPKASVRRCGATTRAAMLAVMPELVQASATPISTPAPSTIGSWLVAVAVSRTPSDVDRTLPISATQRVPCLSASDAGEGLADAPGDLLHRDGEREVGDRDAELVRGRRLEQAEVLPDAHGEGHHQRGAAQHGVSLAARNLRNVEGFLHGGGAYGARLAADQ